MSPEARALHAQQQMATQYTFPLYQKETLKALENFPITGVPFSFRLAQAIAAVKWAAAEANRRHHGLPDNIAQAIKMAAREIMEGQHKIQCVVDQIQGGAGTSMHMNLNEVIATRANSIAGIATIHPNDHVNMGQSTNDVIPTAMKLASLQHIDALIAVYDSFIAVLEERAHDWHDIFKVGRTHLQDAVPMTLGQEFGAHASMARRDRARLVRLKETLYATNMGGTAIGTGLNSSRAFADDVNTILSDISRYPFHAAENLIDATQYTDAFLEIGTTLTILAANLIKFANDLRLLASGPRAGFGEITFAPLQKGSSIMPGKVNPVMPETLNQACFQLVGNTHTIFMAIQAGQLELNVFLPIAAKNIFESFTILTQTLNTFTERGLKTLEANPAMCAAHYARSYAPATALSPTLGYEQTTAVVQKMMQDDLTLKEAVVQQGILSAEQYDTLTADRSILEW